MHRCTTVQHGHVAKIMHGGNGIAVIKLWQSHSKNVTLLLQPCCEAVMLSHIYIVAFTVGIFKVIVNVANSNMPTLHKSNARIANIHRYYIQNRIGNFSCLHNNISTMRCYLCWARFVTSCTSLLLCMAHICGTLVTLFYLVKAR